jgi:hypothetical protein
MGYLPARTYALPNGNVIALLDSGALLTGSPSRWWELRELQPDGTLVQRRRYATEEDAVAWIESVGAVPS